jgi:Na+/melibiose symporter-like transporter
MKDNNKTEPAEVLLALGVLIPIFMGLAPKDIRKEVFEYTMTFIAVIIALSFAYFFIKERAKQKRRKEEFETLQRINREREERYKRTELEKQKRED